MDGNNKNFQILHVGISQDSDASTSDNDHENDDEYSGSSSSLDQAVAPPPCLVDLKKSGWDDCAVSKCFQFATGYEDSINLQNTFEPVVNKSLNDIYSTRSRSVKELEIKTKEKDSPLVLHIKDNGSSSPTQPLDPTEEGKGITNLPLPSWAL